LAGALVVAGLLFGQLVTLVLALVLTVIFAMLLSAIANQLAKLGVPRAVGALLALLVVLAGWAAVFYVVIPPVSGQIDLLAKNAPSLIDSAEGQIRQLTGLTPAALGAQAQAFVQKLVANPNELLGTVASVGQGTAEAVGGVVLISLTAYYMAARPQPLISGALRLVPPSRQARTERVFERIHAAWFAWCRGLLLDMLITGTITYIALKVISLQFALVLAVLTAVLLVIPFFGAIIGGIPAVLLGLTQSPGKALVVLIVYLGIHQLEGNLIAPVVMGRTINLHPALLGFGVVIVGALLGALGLIVAVPVIALVAVLVEELWMVPLAGQAPAD
jgi:predicted PurR-regulated permease PerM